MDSIDFGYSTKNIPTHSKSSYLYKLIGKVEKMLKRMRWKALFFDRDQANSNTNVNNNVQHQHINTFNLKTRNCPPKIQDMKEFEKDIQTMIESIKFRCSQNEFQKKLKEDIKLITYKKADISLPERINREAEKVAKTFNIADRLDIMAKQKCFTQRSQRRL